MSEFNEDSPIHVRCEPRQKRAIKNKADYYGLSFSEYVIKACLKDRGPLLDIESREALRNLHSAATQIGNEMRITGRNLNRLLELCERSALGQMPEGYLAVQDLQAIAQQLQETYKPQLLEMMAAIDRDMKEALERFHDLDPEDIARMWK